ncbi:hypothetical protein GCM10023192_39240 [Amycolatopsis samaneae]
MSKSKRYRRTSRLGHPVGRSNRPSRRASEQPGWPAAFLHGAVYTLGKKTFDWLVDLFWPGSN